MIKFRTFRRALKHTTKINVTDIQADNSFSFEKASFDPKTKEYVFWNVDGIDGVDFVIRQHDISLITRKNTNDPDNEFVFLINMKNGKQYGMTFFMKDGYSFFIDDFDYEVKVMSGLPTISFIDKSSDMSAQALDVKFICGNANDKNGVIIGICDGEFILTAVN